MLNNCLPEHRKAIILNFIHNFWTYQSNHFLPFIASLWQVQLWRFCCIKYMHNGPFNELMSFGIPHLIFQINVAVITTTIAGLFEMQNDIFGVNFN